VGGSLTYVTACTTQTCPSNRALTLYRGGQPDHRGRLLAPPSLACALVLVLRSRNCLPSLQGFCFRPVRRDPTLLFCCQGGLCMQHMQRGAVGLLRLPSRQHMQRGAVGLLRLLRLVTTSKHQIITYHVTNLSRARLQRIPLLGGRSLETEGIETTCNVEISRARSMGTSYMMQSCTEILLRLLARRGRRPRVSSSAFLRALRARTGATLTSLAQAARLSAHHRTTTAAP
jgi:hypothetical protein